MVVSSRVHTAHHGFSVKTRAVVTCGGGFVVRSCHVGAAHNWLITRRIGTTAIVLGGVGVVVGGIHVGASHYVVVHGFVILAETAGKG